MLEVTRKTVRTVSASFVTLLLLSLPAVAEEHKAAGTASAESGEVVKVGVFYATNRRPEAGGAGELGYGGDRGSPSFGRCEVEFTPVPFLDQVLPEIPFYLPSETHEVRLTGKADDEMPWDGLAGALSRTSTGSLVVFVHGYNYGFERTCRMAAEMQRYLDGKTTVAMFTWPSNGLPTDYLRDLADVEWSVPFLARFLAELGERVGADKLRLLAHSLGSRGAVLALERLASETDARPLVGQFVLLAPDFDSETFVERLPRLAALTDGITLYASSNDSPLKLSHQLSGHARLGEAGPYLTVVEGMETIDVSPAGLFQIFGHEYFYYHPQVAADLALLLTEGVGAAARPTLRPRRKNGIRYWEIRKAAAP
jgi:esterase/lipase superfamily enzyme